MAYSDLGRDALPFEFMIYGLFSPQHFLYYFFFFLVVHFCNYFVISDLTKEAGFERDY